MAPRQPLRWARKKTTPAPAPFRARDGSAWGGIEARERSVVEHSENCRRSRLPAGAYVANCWIGGQRWPSQHLGGRMLHRDGDTWWSCCCRLLAQLVLLAPRVAACTVAHTGIAALAETHDANAIGVDVGARRSRSRRCGDWIRQKRRRLWPRLILRVRVPRCRPRRRGPRAVSADRDRASP